MLVVMKHNASDDDILAVVEVIKDLGYDARPIPGGQRTAVGLIGNDGRVDSARLEGMPGVLEVIAVTQPYKQVSREWREEDTIVTLANGTTFGGSDIAVMAGPCAVEGEGQILDVAHRLRESGATVLRGGAFKPRTSPYSFQGMGVEGLELLALARDATGMAIVTEAVDPETIDLVAEYADIIQIGARNMQNYVLLRRAGRLGKPVLLKRGMSATIDELLLAAEYILAEGNEQVILCERGVRSFDTHTRNLLDLTAIPVVQALSHLPIVADPSHGTGIRAKVIPMARAAVAAGADGLIVEVHPDPPRAMSDGAQSLYPDQFGELMTQIKVIATAIGRTVLGLPAAIGVSAAQIPADRSPRAEFPASASVESPGDLQQTRPPTSTSGALQLSP
ncbi:MAG: 3-deoxy-7-phosphoheptulonate synthase, partial [Gemmatimonadetes bacterium]|nr:3-deoxy-7-phosphoheptulonate synthase [Gemmatimonadota bacterium]